MFTDFRFYEFRKQRVRLAKKKGKIYYYSEEHVKRQAATGRCALSNLINNFELFYELYVARYKKFTKTYLLIIFYCICLHAAFISGCCPGSTIERICFTDNGGHVIRIYCYGHTLDNTRSGGRMYWFKGKKHNFIL